jgi:hypothetical protein
VSVLPGDKARKHAFQRAPRGTTLRVVAAEGPPWGEQKSQGFLAYHRNVFVYFVYFVVIVSAFAGRGAAQRMITTGRVANTSCSRLS